MLKVNDSYMNLSRQSSVTIKASLIIQLIDGFTGRSPIQEGLSVTIEGLSKQPTKKANGFFVFTNLADGPYVVTIRSSYYLQKRQVISNSYDDRSTPTLIVITPRSSYPNQHDVTSLHVSLRNQKNEQVSGTEITATVTTPKCSVAKLAKNHPTKESKEITVAKSSEIFVGDHFSLVGKATEQSEFCSIIGRGDDHHTYLLRNELRFDYARGSLLLPVVKTITDERGNALLFFRNYSLKSFEIVLEIKNGNHSIKKEVSLEDGEKKNLGIIAIK